MRILLTILVFMLCFQTKGQFEPKVMYEMDAFLFCDTSDPRIGAKADYVNMSRQIRRMARGANLKLNLFGFMGAKFHADQIDQIIQKGKTNSSTRVTIFYYSGHGYRLKTDTSTFPNLKIPGGYVVNSNALHDRLKKSQSGFLLTIIDACNNEIPESKATNKNSKGAVLPDSEGGNFDDLLALNFDAFERFFDSIPFVMAYNEMKNYKYLFREIYGDVFLSSSDIGQVSLGNQIVGGLYTRSLIESLRTTTLRGLVDPNNWEIISNRAQTLTLERNGGQRPIWNKIINHTTPSYTKNNIEEPPMRLHAGAVPVIKDKEIVVGDSIDVFCRLGCEGCLYGIDSRQAVDSILYIFYFLEKGNLRKLTQVSKDGRNEFKIAQRIVAPCLVYARGFIAGKGYDITIIY